LGEGESLVLGGRFGRLHRFGHADETQCATTDAEPTCGLEELLAVHSFSFAGSPTAHPESHNVVYAGATERFSSRQRVVGLAVAGLRLDLLLRGDT
jgi:hypothetical protein